MIVGGYGAPMEFNMFDKTCRAFQHAIMDRLAEGKGFVFRMGGEVNGKPIQHILWISPSSPVRFEYDTDVLPPVDQELLDVYKQGLAENGHIIFPSLAELESLEAELASQSQSQG